MLQRRHLLSTAWASIKAATGARRSLLATTSETLIFEFSESVVGFNESSIDVTNGEVRACCISHMLCTEQVPPIPGVAGCKGHQAAAKHDMLCSYNLLLNALDLAWLHPSAAAGRSCALPSRELQGEWPIQAYALQALTSGCPAADHLFQWQR